MPPQQVVHVHQPGLFGSAAAVYRRKSSFLLIEISKPDGGVGAELSAAAVNDFFLACGAIADSCGLPAELLLFPLQRRRRRHWRQEPTYRPDIA